MHLGRVRQADLPQQELDSIETTHVEHGVGVVLILQTMGQGDT